jgi:poly(3-hydroxybutyrate) depolymerase
MKNRTTLFFVCFFGILTSINAQQPSPADTCAFARFAPGLTSFAFASTNTTQIVYGVNSTTNVARVYRPNGDINTCRPVVIWAHGGGFSGGSYTEQKTTEMMAQLARKGYVAITMRYRLWPGTPANSLEYSEAMIRGLQDMIAAVRYVKGNAAILGIDSSQVFIGGSSAGAIIANHVAFMDASEANPTALANQGGNYNVSTISTYTNIPFTVAGCVTQADSLWNLTWLTGETTPWGAVHNSSDPTVPYNSGGGSAQIFTQLQSQNIKSYLKTTFSAGLHTPFPAPNTYSLYVDTFNLASYTQLFSLLKHHNASTITVSGNSLTTNGVGISYQWFLNGTAINSATLQSHIATSSGTYNVKTQNCATCYSSSNLVTHTLLTTSLNNIKALSLTTSIFPQPVSEILYVSASEVITSLSIQSIDGHIISHHIINGKNAEISAVTLAQSIYILKVEFEDNKVKFYRFIKS